jgi:hypothetical protein
MTDLITRLRRCLLPLVFLGAVQAPSVHAISPEEFAAMAPEDALRLPVVEALEVFGWRHQEFLFVLENALIDLRYLYRQPSGKRSDALSAAVRTFQREAGYDPTGVLLVEEFMELIQRGNQFWQAPVYPGPLLYSETAHGVSLEGTWVSRGGPERDPIQTTNIRCVRAASLCTAVTARLVMADDEEGWFHASAIDLTLGTRDWSVTRWTDERIEAEDRSSLCVVQRLTVDLKRQGATMRNEPQADERCKAAAPEASEYRLEGGYEIAARYWEERQTRAHKLRSKAFQQLVERVSKRPAKQ